MRRNGGDAALKAEGITVDNAGLCRGPFAGDMQALARRDILARRINGAVAALRGRAMQAACACGAVYAATLG